LEIPFFPLYCTRRKVMYSLRHSAASLLRHVQMIAVLDDLSQEGVARS
jgi:hypothetical protein